MRPTESLVLTQADIDQLVEALADVPFRHAEIVLRWVSSKIERQIEINRETDEEIARILRELDEESGGRERRFTFFDCMQTRRPDEPLN